MARVRQTRSVYYKNSEVVKVVFLFASGLVLLLFVAAYLSSTDPFTILRAAAGRRPQICTDEYAPVCGKDGMTYSNKCYAKREGVAPACDGECPCLGYGNDTPQVPLKVPGY